MLDSTALLNTKNEYPAGGGAREGGSEPTYLSFNVNAFSEPTFDANEFVRVCLSSVGLGSVGDDSAAHTMQTLRIDLHSYGEKLAADLVDLLNSEYTEFLSLSSNLVGTNDTIAEATSKLNLLRARLAEGFAVVDSAANAIKQNAAATATNLSHASTLTQLRDIDSIIKKIDALLEYTPSPSSSSFSASLSLSSPSSSSSSLPTEAPNAAFAQYLLLADAPATASSSSPSSSALLSASSPDAEKFLLLQRICQLVARLSLLMTRNKRFEFVADKAPTVHILLSSLQQQLTSLLLASLPAISLSTSSTTSSPSSSSSSSSSPTASSVPSVLLVLEAYAACEWVDVAHANVKTLVITPVLEELLTPALIQELEGSEDGKVLTSFLNKVLRYVEQDLLVLFVDSSPSASSSASSSSSLSSSSSSSTLAPFNFLLNAFFPALHRLLTSKLPSLFSAALPDVFRHNFRVFRRFLRSLERLCCPHQAALLAFHEHPLYLDIKHKLKAGNAIFFQLQFQKIAGPFNQRLSAPQCHLQLVKHEKTDEKKDEKKKGEKKKEEEGCAGGSMLLQQPGVPFQLVVFHELWAAVEQCWANENFLSWSGSPMFGLCLQLLRRASNWVHGGLGLKNNGGLSFSPASSSSSSSSSAPSSSPSSAAVAPSVASVSAGLHVNYLLELLATETKGEGVDRVVAAGVVGEAWASVSPTVLLTLHADCMAMVDLLAIEQQQFRKNEKEEMQLIAMITARLVEGDVEDGEEDKNKREIGEIKRKEEREKIMRSEVSNLLLPSYRIWDDLCVKIALRLTRVLVDENREYLVEAIPRLKNVVGAGGGMDTTAAEGGGGGGGEDAPSSYVTAITRYLAILLPSSSSSSSVAAAVLAHRMAVAQAVATSTMEVYLSQVKELLELSARTGDLLSKFRRKKNKGKDKDGKDLKTEKEPASQAEQLQALFTKDVAAITAAFNSFQLLSSSSSSSSSASALAVSLAEINELLASSSSK